MGSTYQIAPTNGLSKRPPFELLVLLELELEITLDRELELVVTELLLELVMDELELTTLDLLLELTTLDVVLDGELDVELDVDEVPPIIP